MREDQIENLRQILCHYGREAQKAKLCEELRELDEAARDDLHSNTPETRSHFIEELADVSIMVEQMRLALTIPELAELYKVIEFKINRQLRRIENEEP